MSKKTVLDSGHPAGCRRNRCCPMASRQYRQAQRRSTSRWYLKLSISPNRRWIRPNGARIFRGNMTPTSAPPNAPARSMEAAVRIHWRPTNWQQDPRLKTIFAGYAFSVDYRARRGHAYMLTDQRETKRVQLPFRQTGACLQCHASNANAYRKRGLKMGLQARCRIRWSVRTAMPSCRRASRTIGAMPYDGGDQAGRSSHGLHRLP